MECYWCADDDDDDDHYLNVFFVFVLISSTLLLTTIFSVSLFTIVYSFFCFYSLYDGAGTHTQHFLFHLLTTKPRTILILTMINRQIIIIRPKRQIQSLCLYFSPAYNTQLEKNSFEIGI